MKEQGLNGMVLPGGAGALPYLTRGRSRAINAENRTGIGSRNLEPADHSPAVG